MLHPNQVRSDSENHIQKEIVMADECGYVRVWDIVAGRFRVEMVLMIDCCSLQCPDDNVPLHAMTISHDVETV